MLFRSIAGVRKIVDFSCASTLHPLIMFISSVSAVGSWSATHDIPEEPIHDLHVAAKMGYGQSKLVSELILEKAAKMSGIQSICCRVGIVAGPVEQSLGMWNAHEYFPSVSSSPQSMTKKRKKEKIRLIYTQGHDLLSISWGIPGNISITRQSRLDPSRQSLQDST